MFEKILVPLDGSELAESALPYAEEMVGRLGSELTLLHTSQSAEDPYCHIYQSYLEKVAANTRHGIERYLRKEEERAIKIDTQMLVGHPAEQIVDYADSQGIDLVIIATHGRSGVRRWALGSIADKVVKGATRPVLLIRSGSPRPEVRERGILNKAIVPLDGSEEGETVIQYIEELAYRFKAELFLLGVVTQVYSFYTAPEYAVYPSEHLESVEALTKDYLEKVGAQLRQRGISTKCDVRVGNVADEIIAFADEINADVIAMTTHGRSGVSRWALGSVADKVLHKGTVPLLLVRASGAGAHS